MGDEAGQETENQFVEIDGEKFQADPNNEGEPLKDDDGQPIPFEEGGEEGEEGGEQYVEIEGQKFKADPNNPDEPLKDDDDNPIPFEEKKSSKKDKEEGDEEPPVRKKDKKDFIIQRLQKKRDKDKEEKEGGEEEEVDEEEEERVGRIVEKKFGKKFEKVDEVENETELDKFFANPENKKFKEDEEKIRKWWKHPSRNNLPIESVAYEVSGKRLEKMGADKAREADKEADKTGGGGHSSRFRGVKKDPWEMTKEEFEAQQEEVRRRERE